MWKNMNNSVLCHYSLKQSIVDLKYAIAQVNWDSFVLVKHKTILWHRKEIPIEREKLLIFLCAQWSFYLTISLSEMTCQSTLSAVYSSLHVPSAVCQRGGGWGALHDPQRLCAELLGSAHTASTQPQNCGADSRSGRHHEGWVSRSLVLDWNVSQHVPY